MCPSEPARHERLGWLLVGTGLALWAFGDMTWALGAVPAGGSGVVPSIPQILYLLSYPMLFAAIVSLTVERAAGVARLRIVLDSAIGSVAVFGIAWHLYFEDRLADTQAVLNASVLGQVGDLILIATALALIIRVRASWGSSVVAVLPALFVLLSTLGAGLVNVAVSGFVAGSRVDLLWLVGHGFALAAAVVLLKAPGAESARHRERTSSAWSFVLPYLAVAALLGIMFTNAVEWGVLSGATAVVALLVFVRQMVAIGESRALVERRGHDLIASISHELRTPMTTVSGFAQILDSTFDDMSPGEAKELVGIIDRHAQHVNRIVDDLIGLAQDSLRFPELHPEPVELTATVLDSVSRLDGISPEPVVVETELPGSCWVQADPGRLGQIVLNLLTNAERYGDRRILLEVRLEGGVAVLGVHDNGPGVPKRFEQAIWERFERGPNRYNSVIPGSGVGLSIVQGLVEAHDGTIRLQRSRRLGGACFEVRLPAIAAPAAVLVD